MCASTAISRAAESRQDPPLVTVGIPAYNRPAELERAVRSALAQEHRAVEVLVSDDASPNPEMGVTLARLEESDDRVRAVRQPVNLGHAANYQWVLEAARGEFFMWLADDDWIDAGYVSDCLAVLEHDPTARLACGRARYYVDGRHATDERPIDLRSARSGLRLVGYFARVSVNGPLFSVARTRELRETGFPAVAGGDWITVAGQVTRGTIRAVPGVWLHRSMTGLGSDPGHLTASFGLSGIKASQHHAFLALRLWRDIASGAEPLALPGRVTRIFVGTAVGGLVIARFTVADAVRRTLGPARSARLERRVAGWLRSRDRW